MTHRDPTTFRAGPMIVCGQCGNKRCPHAQSVNFLCTGSNEPVQRVFDVTVLCSTQAEYLLADVHAQLAHANAEIKRLKSLIAAHVSASNSAGDTFGALVAEVGEINT